MIESRVWVPLLSAMLASEAAFAQAAVASRNTATSALVGEWRGEIVSGAITTRLSLNVFENGTYAQTSTMISEYGWTLEGETLFMAPVVARGAEKTYGKAMALRVQVEGDSLVATASSMKLVLHRQTVPINESRLLGRWQGMSEQNEPVTQDFTDDGRLMITTILTREAGRYSINRHEILWHEQIPRPRRHRSRYKVEEDKLTLLSPAPLPPVELFRVRRDATN